MTRRSRPAAQLHERSEEMILAAFFLSTHGERPTSGGPSLPPRELGTTSWKHAYAAFFNALAGGRTFTSFASSLKNARDVFDGHTDSGRAGWRRSSADREPIDLPMLSQKVHKRWSSRPREVVWAALVPYADLEAADIPRTVFTDLDVDDNMHLEGDARTEGGAKVRLSVHRERDPVARARALRIHGTACLVCGFDFGLVYGAWGEGFVEVHHLSAFAGDDGKERRTDARTDLAVLCANCHRMVHRKRGVVLTLEELRKRVRIDAIRDWARALPSA